jgi:hypothetical protein
MNASIFLRHPYFLKNTRSAKIQLYGNSIYCQSVMFQVVCFEKCFENHRVSFTNLPNELFVYCYRIPFYISVLVFQTRLSQWFFYHSPTFMFIQS